MRQRIHSWGLILAGAFGLIALGMATPAAAQSWPGQQPGYGGQQFRCDSIDGRYRECRVDTRGGVRLVRQVSKAACIEGRSWGVRQNAVWVDGGCRAEFMTGYGAGYGNNRYPGYGYGHGGQYGGRAAMLCSSDGGRYRECPFDTRGGVELVRQVSSTRCIQGRNWGTRNGVIWVDGGCRAEFASRAGYGSRPGNYGRGNRGYGNRGYDNRGYGQGQMIECASHNGRRHYCPVRTGRGVQLVHQQSRSACIEGRSWGWDRSGIWVDGGCRAQFRLY
ncbi:DUF3011 domain-containing protein [Luteimonas sp. e5]